MSDSESDHENQREENYDYQQHEKQSDMAEEGDYPHNQKQQDFEELDQNLKQDMIENDSNSQWAQEKEREYQQQLQELNYRQGDEEEGENNENNSQKDNDSLFKKEEENNQEVLESQEDFNGRLEKEMQKFEDERKEEEQTLKLREGTKDSDKDENIIEQANQSRDQNEQQEKDNNHENSFQQHQDSQGDNNSNHSQGQNRHLQSQSSREKASLKSREQNNLNNQKSEVMDDSFQENEFMTKSQYERQLQFKQEEERRKQISGLNQNEEEDDSNYEEIDKQELKAKLTQQTEAVRELKELVKEERAINAVRNQEIEGLKKMVYKLQSSLQEYISITPQNSHRTQAAPTLLKQQKREIQGDNDWDRAMLNLSSEDTTIPKNKLWVEAKEQYAEKQLYGITKQNNQQSSQKKVVNSHNKNEGSDISQQQIKQNVNNYKPNYSSQLEQLALANQNEFAKVYKENKQRMQEIVVSDYKKMREEAAERRKNFKIPAESASNQGSKQLNPISINKNVVISHRKPVTSNQITEMNKSNSKVQDENSYFYKQFWEDKTQNKPLISLTNSESSQRVSLPPITKSSASLNTQKSNSNQKIIETKNSRVLSVSEKGYPIQNIPKIYQNQNQLQNSQSNKNLIPKHPEMITSKGGIKQGYQNTSYQPSISNGDNLFGKIFPTSSKDIQIKRVTDKKESKIEYDDKSEADSRGRKQNDIKRPFLNKKK